MAKMTKTQARRMIRDIESKSKKLFMMNWGKRVNVTSNVIVTSQDIAAIEKLCKKWMNRIG